jgi:hypothetical protein
MQPSSVEAALRAAENLTPSGRHRLHPEYLGLSPADVKAGRKIWRIRQQRAANRPLSQADLARAMQARTVEEIRARYERVALESLERNIKGCAVTTTLDLARAAALVRIEGWARYRGAAGNWKTSLAVLVVYDHDHGERRALRVSPRVTSVAEALESLMPVAVRRAENLGVRVYRQGDMYFVPSRRADYRALEGTRHEVVNGVVVHPEHKPLHLPGPCKAYRQIVIASGRFGGRRLTTGD